MDKLTLVIGNKNYSSWSLRPWLLLKQAGIPFGEVRIPLYLPESRARLLEYSPSGKVPVLLDGATRIWDSLAICEYVAERFAQARLWPEESAMRAEARSISAEMHSGFAAMRSQMPMNCRRSQPDKALTAEVERDITRIVEIWESCRHRHAVAGPFLFGRFTVADAMYAPVAWRFLTYGVELSEPAQAYATMLRSLPAMQEWRSAALAEREVLPQFEGD